MTEIIETLDAIEPGYRVLYCDLWGCLHDGVRGQPLVETLLPEEKDYFVLKPKHSGFYSTTLEILLRYLQVESLILTGIAGNNCVLFTANDAYMRDYRLFVLYDPALSGSPGSVGKVREVAGRLMRAAKERGTAVELLSAIQAS